jgi:hypothetical protein
VLALAEATDGYWLPAIEFDTMVAAYLLGDST